VTRECERDVTCEWTLLKRFLRLEVKVNVKVKVIAIPNVLLRRRHIFRRCGVEAHLSSPRTRSDLPSNVAYTRQHVVYSLRHLAYPSPNSWWDQNAPFSTPLALEPPSFRKGVTYLKHKTNLFARRLTLQI